MSYQTKHTTNSSYQSRNTTAYYEQPKGGLDCLLLESGDYVLQENKGPILLESSVQTSWTYQSKS